MEKFILQNNDITQFMPIAVVKPQPVFFIKEESSMYRFRDYNFAGTSPTTENADTTVDVNYGINHNMNLNSFAAPSDYIGAAVMEVPHTILEQFGLFQYYDITATPPTSLAGGSIDSKLVDLFDSSDTDPKLASVTAGLQFLRIPANKFNDIDSDGAVTNRRYGLFYIKVSPQFIQVPVLQIIDRFQLNFNELLTSVGNSTINNFHRRRRITFDKTAFYNTNWQFEAQTAQQGRLYGSVVEVWDANNVIKKQTLICNEDNLLLGTPSSPGEVVLQPELVGYDPITQTVAPGDILKFYPRESYFKPILVELKYQDPATDVATMVQFMVNDVVQDSSTATYEIYDKDGVTSDGQGNLSGTVIQAYQISQEGKFTIRRHIKLNQ